jgi:hypothetical protein
MLLVLIDVLVIIVVGAILFYLIDRFVRDGRLANPTCRRRWALVNGWTAILGVAEIS